MIDQKKSGVMKIRTMKTHITQQLPKPRKELIPKDDGLKNWEFKSILSHLPKKEKGFSHTTT
jgi:hypothetical protein